ncbi:uncharacterized protein LOC62_01G000115 [Vanrija pseudolonga]|uniref:Uncharacterized protein n=1 Tax=Vanrija pseudolonga TaxID=143232 RepID=A0AAF0Y4E4_9TREE|nr:hypothetical protein LOC62_01G000115 [Vanrija pseudolonga]
MSDYDQHNPDATHWGAAPPLSPPGGMGAPSSSASSSGPSTPTEGVWSAQETGRGEVLMYPSVTSVHVEYMDVVDAKRYLKESVRAGLRRFRHGSDGFEVQHYALEDDGFVEVLVDAPYFSEGEEVTPAFREAFKLLTGWQYVQVPRFSYTSTEYLLAGAEKWVLITPSTNQVFALGAFMEKMTDGMVDALDSWADNARVHALPTDIIEQHATGLISGHHLAAADAPFTFPVEGSDLTLDDDECTAVHMVLQVAKVVLYLAAPYGIVTNGTRHFAIAGLMPYRNVSISRSWGHWVDGQRLPHLAGLTPDTIFDALAKLLCSHAYPPPPGAAAPQAPATPPRPTVASKMPRSHLPPTPGSSFEVDNLV